MKEVTITLDEDGKMSINFEELDIIETLGVLDLAKFHLIAEIYSEKSEEA